MPRVLSCYIPSLALASMLLSPGCVTPVTLGQDHFGVGIYRVRSLDYDGAVTYREVEGVGLTATTHAVTLGYTSRCQLIAPLHGADYAVDTPMGSLAVGPSAEAVAESEGVASFLMLQATPIEDIP